MKSIRKNIYSFYISFMLIIIASSLPHAVLTILLLDKGISLSQIMLIQASFNLAVIISEYPSGLLADIFSKKQMFLYSKFLLILMFLLIIYSSNFYVLALAWFIYGVSGALDSGTLDAKIINDLKSDGLKYKLDNFISNSNVINFISLIIGSTLGSFLYYKIGINFYWFSIAFVVISASIIKLFYVENDTNHRSKIKFNNFFKGIIVQSKEGIYELKKSTSLKAMVLLSFFGQFFFQTHFQMWQAIFIFKNINKHDFYIYYILFQIISIVAYKIPIKRLFFMNNKIIYYFYAFMILGAIGLFSRTSFFFIISYLILIFCFTVFDYISTLLFAQNVSQKHISSLTSLKSSISRIASLSSLVISSMLLTFENTLIVVTENFVFAIFISILIVIIFKKIVRKNQLQA